MILDRLANLDHDCLLFEDTEIRRHLVQQINSCDTHTFNRLHLVCVDSKHAE